MAKEKIKAFLNSRKVQAVGFTVLCVLLPVAFLLQMFHKSFSPNGNDFTIFLMAAKDFLAGLNPYKAATPFPYVYPLFVTFVLVPFTLLPYWLACLLWYLIKLALYYLIVKLLVEMGKGQIKAGFDRTIFFPLAVFSLLFLNAIQSDLRSGHVETFVLAACMLFAKYYWEKKYLISALFLSAAISIKVVPGILLLYLLMKKDFKTIFLCALIVPVYCVALPYVFSGPEIFGHYRYWINSFVLGNVDWATRLYKEDFCDLHSVILYYLPGLTSVGYLKHLSMLLVFFVLAFIDGVLCKKRNCENELVLVMLYLAAILLIAPIFQIHYLMFIFPGAAFIVLKVFFDKEWQNTEILAAIVAFFACLILGKIVKHGPFYFFSIAVLMYLLTRALTGSTGKLQKKKR